MRMGRNGQMERSISIGPIQPKKSGPPREVGRYFRNFSGWTEPFHSVLSPGQTDSQVVATSQKLNLRRDLRWVAKRTCKFPGQTKSQVDAR